MPVGFEVINDHGSILIDANYPNLALIAQGTVNVGSNTFVGGMSGTITVPNTGKPAVFVRSAGLVAIVDAQPGTFTYLLANGVTTFDYWVFAPPQSIPRNFGAQVFDANGKLCFDAAQSYMRVTGLINMGSTFMTYPDTGGVGQVLSYPLPGATPAVCLNDPGYQFQILTGASVSGGTQYRTIARCGVRMSGSTLELAHFQSRADLSLPVGVNVNTRTAATPMSVLVADVTGMVM